MLVNIHQYNEINKNARTNYKSLHFYKTGNLIEEAIERDNSARRYVAMFYYLGKLFPHSTIVIPKNRFESWFTFEVSIFSYGKASSLIIKDYDSVVLWPENNVDIYKIDNFTYAKKSSSNLNVLAERFDFFVLDGNVEKFYIITPDGNPGHDKKIIFMDERLFN